MDQFNLFEPDLELGRSLIPYEDQEIQGVWPRKQRQPSDVFPTNAALIGRGPNRDARWLRANKDGILLTDDINGSGLGATIDRSTDTQFTEVFFGGSGHTVLPIPDPTPRFLYSITFGLTVAESFTSSDNMSKTIVYLGDDDNSKTITIATGWIRINAPDPTWNEVVKFNPPIALNETWGPTTANLYLYVYSGSYDLYCLCGCRCSVD